MKLKRKSNLLLSADFIQPEVIVAECSEDLSRDEVAKIVWNNNFGEDVYILYKMFRDDMHIVNVVQFLEKLEKLYVEVEKEKFARQRRMEKPFEEMSVNGKWEKTFEKVSKEYYMSIELFLEEAQKQQFQPYYACYWYCFNLPIGYFAESNAHYIAWINQRHEDFKPFSKHLYSGSGKYFYEFMIYLKEYVTKNRKE